MSDERTKGESVTEPEVWGDGCECWVTPEHMWLSAASCGYGSGYEPGSQVEFNPRCPKHGDHVERAVDGDSAEPVEKVARAIHAVATGGDAWGVLNWDEYTSEARAALEAVGLPALLERVEAANVAAQTFRDMYETEHRQLLAALVDGAALVAKLAHLEEAIERAAHDLDSGGEDDHRSILSLCLTLFIVSHNLRTTLAEAASA